MQLHNLYRNWRQRQVPFPANGLQQQREQKYFDDLRQMQMNVPIFDDIMAFVLDKNPLVTKVDKKAWKLHVKNEENWKVFGACKILYNCCQTYEKLHT